MGNDQEAPSAGRVPCHLQAMPMVCVRGPAPVDKRGGTNTSRWRKLWGGRGFRFGFSALDSGPRLCLITANSRGELDVSDAQNDLQIVSCNCVRVILRTPLDSCMPCKNYEAGGYTQGVQGSRGERWTGAHSAARSCYFLPQWTCSVQRGRLGSMGWRKFPLG